MGEEPRPTDESLATYHCATDEEMAATLDELRSSFSAEVALLA